MSGGISFNPGQAPACAAAGPNRKRKGSTLEEESLDQSGWIADLQNLDLYGCTKEQEEAFLEIYKTLYEVSFAGLVFHKARLEGLAESVRAVPPLSFLILIQKQPLLGTYLCGIKDGAVNFPYLLRGQSPWERTVYDFHQSFMEHKAGEILGLSMFIERIEKPRGELIQRLIEQNQFRELLEYFMMN
jgi:hypothetical protein